MNFILREKTKNEIEQERKENVYWAKRVKGLPDKDICPLEVTMKNGQTFPVWNLTETHIISLVQANVKEMTPKGSADKAHTADSFKIIKCWSEKYKKVSAEFVSNFFTLKNMNKGAQREIVRDMLTPVINETLEEGARNAKFLKGIKDDFTPVTETEVIKAIKEQERQEEKRKEIEKAKTV